MCSGQLRSLLVSGRCSQQTCHVQLPHVWPTSPAHVRVWISCIDRHPRATVQADLEASFPSHSAPRIAVHSRGRTSLDNARCSAQQPRSMIQAAVLQDQQKLMRTTFTYIYQLGHRRPAGSALMETLSDCILMTRCLASRSPLAGTQSARRNGRVKATQRVPHTALHTVEIR